MPRLRTLVTLGTLGLALSGCVSAEDYAKIKLERDQLAEQLGHSQSEINEAQARADALARQMQQQGNVAGTQSAMYVNLQNQISDLQKQNEDWSKRYSDAMALVGASQGGQALPQGLSNELTEFANQNPDLVEFDAARGIVKFKSDVTFAVGDATVTPKAKQVLARFGSILNSAGADGYELLVAGHTDSTPVTNERTRRLGHFDNWYLSAHRAISVGHELVADGVSAKRMGVVGYADQRPIASNMSESGKAQNRRVEVLILPTRATGSAVAEEIPSPSKPRRSHATLSAVPAAAKLDKDTASLSTMNK
jgi:chemotaxis protein MotB